MLPVLRHNETRTHTTSSRHTPSAFYGYSLRGGRRYIIPRPFYGRKFAPVKEYLLQIRVVGTWDRRERDTRGMDLPKDLQRTKTEHPTGAFSWRLCNATKLELAAPPERSGGRRDRTALPHREQQPELYRSASVLQHQQPLRKGTQRQGGGWSLRDMQ